MARVVLDLRATDDLSTSADIGFRVRVVEGALPGVARPDTRVIDASASRFQIVWSETDAERFDAVLEVVAVDRAGNESAPRRIVVESGGLACSASSGGLRGALGLAPALLVIAAIAWRGRRRASTAHARQIAGVTRGSRAHFE